MNKVVENDTFNVLEYMNIYTGAGVAAGDINNDGLTDLYFSANTGGGKLYLNKGNLKFQDITATAGLIPDRWETGVTMVDINQDGWLDIYVNVAGSVKFGNLANLLYVNKGDGTFKEEAEKYGIADTRLTMNASFFDYDRDGDLDLFLITNPADEMVAGVNTVTDRKKNGESAGTDILYRNNGNGTFTDVSKEAGILLDGYSLGAAISDVNGDGWPDIYVSNDFLTNDILYINNRNGGFADKAAECLKHTSFASMGNDVADFNNDGLPDIFVLDMLPEDNYRKKMIIPAASYDKFQLSIQKGYDPQYTRNTLQLNNGDGSFSDIAFLAGVSSTDWSWSALWADYDNDGDKDLMVTNGFYRDLGNLDYIHYQARLQNPMGRQTAKREEKLKAINALPEIPLTDYLFENDGNLLFHKRSSEWGFTEAGFSNGACYADLDNDGDLELVINQFNREAKIFRNNARELTGNNFLSIRLQGRVPNRQGIGAKLWLHTGDTVQFQEFYQARGFESSMEPVLHFGLGKSLHTDSIVVQWPDGLRQVTYNPGHNRTIVLHQENASDSFYQRKVIENSLMEENADSLGLNYEHVENVFVDFKLQPLLPHMHSQNGPGISVGDINSDGLEDFYIGGASGKPGSFFVQHASGKFRRFDRGGDSLQEEMGVLLFDADGDKDDDLYVVSGGSENSAASEPQQDRLYLNDGQGNFHYEANALPDTRASGSCVSACDYDRDGDPDIFVGGRVVPGQYPLAPQSYLLRNESTSAGARFRDITREVAPALEKIGMVTSSLWTDFDNDGWTDLLLAGEFMPLTFFKNNHGMLRDITAATGIQNDAGWWNSIVSGDFDEDGDIDYVAGNLGLNSRHKASPDEPLCIFAGDYDKNGLIDPVMCYYVNGKNYIYPTRDEMIRQVNPMRGRFQTYESFAALTFEESFRDEELAGAQVVKSHCFETSYFENSGGGKFRRKALPVTAQFAPVYGLLAGDHNGDGHLDLLLAGNSYATEASTGRYDAMKGLLLTGDGKGGFREMKSSNSGFKADRDVKALAELFLEGGNSVVLTGNNNGRMEAYRFKSKPDKTFAAAPRDVYAIVKKRSGQWYRQEFYYGSNYLSQTSRRLKLADDVISVTAYDSRGNMRTQDY